MEGVFKAAGKSFKKSFDAKVQENETAPVISVLADGELGSKAVYFVPWKPSSDHDKLCQSIEQLIKHVMKKAASENYQSIAFPAIGCGEYGCPVSLIAETFVRKVRELLPKYPISILFVIQPEKTDIYEEFRKQLSPSGQQDEAAASPTTSLNIGEGIIEIGKGDITKQIVSTHLYSFEVSSFFVQVDVIIASSSSENLQQSLLAAAGDQVRAAYSKERKANPNSLLISTPPGHLHCKRIFFLKWEPDEDPELLRQSIADLIMNVIQNVRSNKFTSIAFPAIGCGEHACSVDIVVKTMVKKMKQEIEDRKLPWTVKFIIQPNQQNVYDEFCKQLLSSDPSSSTYKVPSTWQRTNDDQMRVIVSKKTDEYNSIISKFDEAMKGKYTEIIKLERVQNERWYMQYIAHWKDFKKRLNEDTEKRLYHGCPDSSADAIIQDCFNRSYAGVNGISFLSLFSIEYIYLF
jgi:O-acetyl-ADP-ribose deacetylase (regulator of RNase III)